MNCVFSYCVPLPMAVKGVTIPQSDTGDYIVFVNENLCQKSRLEAFQHEVSHIKRDHFRDMIDVSVAEKEAIEEVV